MEYLSCYWLKKGTTSTANVSKLPNKVAPLFSRQSVEIKYVWRAPVSVMYSQNVFYIEAHSDNSSSHFRSKTFGCCRIVVFFFTPIKQLNSNCHTLQQPSCQSPIGEQLYKDKGSEALPSWCSIKQSSTNNKTVLMLLTNVTDNWVPIVSKISRNFISSSALLTASFSSRTHSRRKRRYQRSDLDSSPCQSSREDRYRSVSPSALPRFILSVFWVPGHTAEMTDKTEVTSLSQLHRKCPPQFLPTNQ